MVLQTYFRLTLTLNWISLRLWHKSPCPWWSCRHFLVTTYSKLDAPKTLIPIWCLLANARLDKVLRMLLIICSILIGYPQDFETYLILFCLALDMVFQTLFDHTLNLNWIKTRLWHNSNIFCQALGRVLQTLFDCMLNLNWIPKDFDLYPIHFCQTLHMVLQTFWLYA